MDESWKTVVLKRILPGLLLIGIGFTGLAMTLAKGGENLSVMGRALIAFPFLIAGALFLAKPLAWLVAYPILSLLYPEDNSYSPPPLYRLPEMYIHQGRYQEAVLEYQKILHHHRRELRAYLALMELAFQYLQDPTLAEKTYRTGRGRIKDDEELLLLEETYQALKAGAPLANSAIAHYP